MREGRFREDLYHRLNVVHVRVPHSGSVIQNRNLSPKFFEERDTPPPVTSAITPQRKNVWRGPRSEPATTGALRACCTAEDRLGGYGLAMSGQTSRTCARRQLLQPVGRFCGRRSDATRPAWRISRVRVRTSSQNVVSRVGCMRVLAGFRPISLSYSSWDPIQNHTTSRPASIARDR